MYDKATPKFSLNLSRAEKNALFTKVRLNEGSFFAGADRPVVMLSSTSYTPDEDFMELVLALDQCDRDNNVPKI